MISYKELNEKSKELENKYKLNHYELLQRFMFERLLERISVSEYNDNFILKGGLLLSSMFGVDNRTTKDMDTTIKGIDISKNKMIKILNEIFAIELQDNVKFEIVDVTDIREDDEYGGNKYHIIAKMENLKIKIDLDISTGDEVTPRELNYKYNSIFEEKEFLIYSYNAETIFSEKIETVLRRGLYNSRMKDFYDIYMFLQNKKTLINVKMFEIAFLNTIKRRDSWDYLNDYESILDSLTKYERIHSLWSRYTQKNKYANKIDFDEIVNNLKIFLNSINLATEEINI